VSEGQQPIVLPLPTGSPVGADGTILAQPWVSYWQALHNAAKPLGANGATSARPIHNPSAGLTLYVGQQYFDATLGYPVFVKSLNPTVWVNGAGGVV
jgi:hypothetical protein